MPINGINNEYNEYNVNNAYATDPSAIATDAKAKEQEEAAKAAAKAAEVSQVTLPEDTYVPSNNKTLDVDYINSVKGDMKQNIGAFQKMVEFLTKSQADAGNKSATSQLFKLTSMDQASAKAAISEGGEWSVEAVSERILGMAKAFAGDDPAKIEQMRSAYEKGFAAAERAWGGSLPGISYQTNEAVQKGFDDWMAQVTGSAIDPAMTE